jgi:hypothetical protein
MCHGVSWPANEVLSPGTDMEEQWGGAMWKLYVGEAGLGSVEPLGSAELGFTPTDLSLC